MLLKEEVLRHYGNGRLACVNCGYWDIRALSIDHVNNDGAKHRKELKHKDIYKWLKENDYPDGFQTLCMNCQWVKKAKESDHKRTRKGKDKPSLEDKKYIYKLCFPHS